MNDRDIGGLDDQIVVAEGNLAKLKAERDGLLPGWEVDAKERPIRYEREFFSVEYYPLRTIVEFPNLALTDADGTKPDQCRKWEAEIRAHLEAMLAKLGEG